MDVLHIHFKRSLQSMSNLFRYGVGNKTFQSVKEMDEFLWYFEKTGINSGVHF